MATFIVLPYATNTVNETAMRSGLNKKKQQISSVETKLAQYTLMISALLYKLIFLRN